MTIHFSRDKIPLVAEADIATPVAGLFILLLLWRKDVNEGYKKPTALRICMTISYIFVLFMTFSALKTQIPNLIQSITSLF